MPVVDMKGQDQQRFTVDLQECQQYATQRMDALQGAAAGAAAGAILAAVIAPRGYRHNVVGRTALLGAAGGAAGATENQEAIVKRCLAGRGYNVLAMDTLVAPTKS